MYKKVSPNLNFTEREKEVLKFWQENDCLLYTSQREIFERTGI